MVTQERTMWQRARTHNRTCLHKLMRVGTRSRMEHILGRGGQGAHLCGDAWDPGEDAFSNLTVGGDVEEDV